MSYTVVVDLEMCRVPRANKSRYHYGSEIIQIGATALDENYEIVDGYSCYVHPEFGSIDGFIKKLTGISSADVAVAGTIKDAIEDFMKWLPKDAVLVSWSMSDKDQLEREMAEKQIENERLRELFESWIDCQPMFAEKMGNTRMYRLEEALIASDIISYGNAHDGLDDAYNTALLYKKIMTESEFRLNSYYQQAHSEQEVRLTSTMGDLFKGFDLSTLAVA